MVLVFAGGDASSRPFALIMFGLGAFVVDHRRPGDLARRSARRAMTRDPVPIALAQLIRRNRRRYGGYIVHAGLAVLLIGVAASSSFQHSSDVDLSPGQSAKVDGYTIRYVRPTASATAQKISFGAVLDVSKGGQPRNDADDDARLLSGAGPDLGILGRFFNGSSDSNVGLRAGITKDIWTVINPDLTPLQALINKGDRLLPPTRRGS